MTTLNLDIPCPDSMNADTPKTESAAKVLIRDPGAVCQSHLLEGWQSAYYHIRQVFTKGDAVRVVMRDGRSGRVVWDTHQTP